MHMAKAMRERMLEKLEEAMVSLRVVRKSACVDGGWLWAVRLAVGTPVEELARRQDVRPREIFRLEQAERESRITLGALKRAAEAMDCELTYFLTPKRGTLGAMAAARNAAWEKALKGRRLEADERRVAEGKPRRLKDPQLAAIKELVRLAGVGEAARDGEERLRELADGQLGRNSKEIAGSMAAKALKGDRAYSEELVRLALMKTDD
jgi:transcriptional regulator with XRE-family HTH domain